MLQNLIRQYSISRVAQNARLAHILGSRSPRCRRGRLILKVIVDRGSGGSLVQVRANAKPRALGRTTEI